MGVNSNVKAITNERVEANQGLGSAFRSAACFCGSKEVVAPRPRHPGEHHVGQSNGALITLDKAGSGESCQPGATKERGPENLG